MIKHTRQQQYIFLSYINKKLLSDWISLELRQRKNNINLQTINYCKQLPEPKADNLIDQLALYVWINGLKSSNLRQVLKDYGWEEIDPKQLQEDLNKTLEQINLPTFHNEERN